MKSMGFDQIIVGFRLLAPEICRCGSVRPTGKGPVRSGAIPWRQADKGTPWAVFGLNAPQEENILFIPLVIDRIDEGSLVRVPCREIALAEAKGIFIKRLW